MELFTVLIDDRSLAAAVLTRLLLSTRDWTRRPLVCSSSSRPSCPSSYRKPWSGHSTTITLSSPGSGRSRDKS